MPPAPRVVLGVCGSIAAYKAVEVCRRLVDVGAHVIPVMTADAGRFLGEVTLSSLASEPVRTSLWSGDDPVPHIALARTADIVLVAPATARLLGSYAAGIADDLLTATLLATRALSWSARPCTPRCGSTPPPGRTWLCSGSGACTWSTPTAASWPPATSVPGGSPTRTASWPRCWPPCRAPPLRRTSPAGGSSSPPAAPGSRSTRSASWGTARRVSRGKRSPWRPPGGAPTWCWSPPPSTDPPPPGIDVVHVETSAEMEAEVMARHLTADAVVMAAAVADFRPKLAADRKLRKDEGVPDIVLEPTTDILAALGRAKPPGQVLVGFAAETGADDLRERAIAKLRAKHLDAIVANDVTVAEAGFWHDTNAAVIIEADGTEQDVALTSKSALASVVLDLVARRLAAIDGRNTP